MRVMLEIGPKGKKVVAVAPDWPGLERGAKTGDAAIDLLRSYAQRYAPVAELAGMADEFADDAGGVDSVDGAHGVDVVEQYGGTGSTDFWGISFAHSSIDKEAMSDEALERELALMRAGWALFDEVRSRVSAELRRGPRGGGRDRDQIVRHVVANELDWAKGLGVQAPFDAQLTGEELSLQLRPFRDAYCNAIRAFHSEGKMARNWPLRYLIRHTAYHALNHAWEMEDKDLTAERTGRDGDE
jgi:hypothetical protein